MQHIRVLADPGSLCGEAPLWDEIRGRLFWSDCGGGKAYALDWQSGAWEQLAEGIEINGWVLAEDGTFVLTNNAGFWAWDEVNAPRLIADRGEGEPCRLNDCAADARGRVLAGSWFYDPGAAYPLGSLLSLDTDGSVHVLDRGIHLANGLGFSPDDRTLYFNDSAARSIYAYDYDLESGVASNRRVYVKLPETEGLPDGLAVDSEGYVWVAEWYGSRISRYDPDGKRAESVSVPAKQTSSVAFAGADRLDLVITSAGQPEPMPLMPPGYEPTSGYCGGALYGTRAAVPGLRRHRCRIQPPTP